MFILGILNTNQIQDNSIKSQRLIDDNMYEYLADILRNVLDYHPEEPYLLFKKQELSNDNNLNPVVERQLTLLSV